MIRSASRSAICLIVACALSTAMATAVAAAASPKPTARSGLYDTRYCEILVVKGALPKVTVAVWNTIGLNSCPAAAWNAFNAQTLTTQLHAAGVLLNGPRHWVIDAAADSRVGAITTFGVMKMREVANLRIATAAQLIQTPYKTLVVDRTNSWSWDRGRTVYELLSPSGAVYVMQSFSQIVDPTVRIGDLRRLGSRLKLPAGWSYRSRKVAKGLTLQSFGRATIVQDDLQNTYQLLPAALIG